MEQPKQLRLVSYLAPNLFWFYTEVAAYLGRSLGIKTQLEQGQDDPLTDPALLDDRVDVAFICGLPFVLQSRLVPNQLQAIVAPVMQAPRYQDRPVYFSDVIVRADSDLNTLNDLAGKTLCFNDAGSNSGYNLLCQWLIQHQQPDPFFGKGIQSGSHQRSIQWVVAGLADCSAIDSTVLEQEVRDFPELRQQIRVVQSIGPYPMPPVIAAQHLKPIFIAHLQAILLQSDIGLQTAMARAKIQRYASVQSQDYDELGAICDAAQGEHLKIFSTVGVAQHT